MIKHRIKIFHVYQDPLNPDEQIINAEADYATMYAFFKALIDSGKDFDIEYYRQGKEDG